MMLGPPYRRFLACRDCGTLIPIALELHPCNGAATEMAAAREDFAADHGSHSVIELRRTDTESISEGPLWDPMVKFHIELTDGSRAYVATVTRPSVEDERVYTFRPCALRTTACDVDIADGDVRRGLDLEFFPQALRRTKVEDFLGALREAIRDLPTEDLDVAFVDPDDPAISIAPMPEQAFQQLLVASAKIFDPAEVPLIERFLRENRRETGVLALRVRRHAVFAND